MPIVADEPVKEYNDLFFSGFTGVLDDDQAGVGTPVQSPPNTVAYESLLTATIEQGPALMTTVYQDTTINFFDVTSLYYACNLKNETSTATVPISCSISATCINPSGQQVV